MSRFGGRWSDSMRDKLRVPRRYAVSLDALTVDDDNRSGVTLARRVVEAFVAPGIENRFSEDGLTYLGCSVRELKAPAKGVIFYGPTGTGKSTIMGAIATELTNREEPVSYLWIYWTQLLDIVAGTFETEEAQEAIADSPALFIDELGEPEPGPKVGDRVRSLLERRYSAGLPIFAATNLEAAALQERLGVAVASRLRQTTDTVKVGPKDRRKVPETARRLV